MAKFKITDWLGGFSPAQILTFTLFNGKKIGQDEFGNKYYEAKARPNMNHTRRWVIYVGGYDATQVPPEWHGWLHHQTDDVPSAQNANRRTWQQPYEANQTFTDQAYHPPGYGGATRAPATGDYEAWTPPA